MAKRYVVEPARCDGCGRCLGVCPHQVLSRPGEALCAKCVKYCLSMEVPCSEGAVCIAPDRCDGCGRCVQVCPRGAIVPAP